MSKRFLTGFAIAVAFFVAVTSGAFVSAGFYPDEHRWGNYHWNSAAPTLNVGQNFGGHWQAHFNTALDKWDDTVLGLTAVAGGTSSRRCKASNGRIEVCADSYGNTGWLGIAQIWVDGEDHIVRAIAKMNDFYMGPSGYSPYTQDAWRQLVMCQEVGHDFGLGHQNETFDDANLGSCMDYTDDPDGSIRNGGVSNEHPNAWDDTVLTNIYSDHAAESSGDTGSDPESPGPCRGGPKRCGSAPPPAFDMELSEIGQWGRLMGTSQDGGQSTFVQDFGNGYRVHTHVTWTLDVADQVRARERH